MKLRSDIAALPGAEVVAGWVEQMAPYISQYSKSSGYVILFNWLTTEPEAERPVFVFNGRVYRKCDNEEEATHYREGGLLDILQAYPKQVYPKNAELLEDITPPRPTPGQEKMGRWELRYMPDTVEAGQAIACSSGPLRRITKDTLHDWKEGCPDGDDPHANYRFVLVEEASEPDFGEGWEECSSENAEEYRETFDGVPNTPWTAICWHEGKGGISYEYRRRIKKPEEPEPTNLELLQAVLKHGETITRYNSRIDELEQRVKKLEDGE